MSEAPTPPQADPAIADGAAPATKPKDAPVWMLALVVVLALGAGGALGSLLIAPGLVKARQAAAAADHDSSHAGPKKAKKHAKKKGHGKEGESSSYKLDNVIVNPADSQGQRFLMCSLAIQADDPAALDVLREREVELRDRIVTTLTSMTLAELTAAGARDSIRTRLVHAILPVLGPDGEDVELKVFLPSFVIQ